MNPSADVTIPADLAIRSRIEPYDGLNHVLDQAVRYVRESLPLLITAFLLHDHVPPRAFGTALVLAMFGWAAIVGLGRRRQWLREVRSTTQPYTYHAELDDIGARTTWTSVVVYPWSTYARCADVDGALKLWHADGVISYIPVSAATAPLIAFTKTKVRCDGAAVAG